MTGRKLFQVSEEEVLFQGEYKTWRHGQVERVVLSHSCQKLGFLRILRRLGHKISPCCNLRGIRCYGTISFSRPTAWRTPPLVGSWILPVLLTRESAKTSKKRSRTARFSKERLRDFEPVNRYRWLQ